MFAQAIQLSIMSYEREKLSNETLIQPQVVTSIKQEINSGVLMLNLKKCAHYVKMLRQDDSSDYSRKFDLDYFVWHSF